MGDFSLAAMVQGLALGAGLIIAIGAQNAFVLRQGLKRQYVFITASICTLCDAVLILLGVEGLGTLIATNTVLTLIATWGGALFLAWYGLRAFRAALTPGTLEADKAQKQPARLRDVVITILALSLLNPHVYLDTVVLVGSMGAHYPIQARVSFALGAMLASLTWFFGIAYGAAVLTPFFSRPSAWRILDAVVGCVMWIIAITLVWSALSASLH